MPGHQPPTEPPSGYVWVDARRLETLEAQVDRLLSGQAIANTDKITTRGRFFTAFSRLETLELVATATAKKVDHVARVVEAIANRFTVEIPK